MWWRDICSILHCAARLVSSLWLKSISRLLFPFCIVHTCVKNCVSTCDVTVV